MISIAFTKAVVWNGRIRVNHSQCVTIARMSAAVDAKKTTHQIPLYFFVCSIFLLNFSKNKAAWLNEKKSFQLIHKELPGRREDGKYWDYRPFFSDLACNRPPTQVSFSNDKRNSSQYRDKGNDPLGKNKKMIK